MNGNMVDTVDISVVVPVRNEKKNLATIVETLVSDSPCPSRIVLVDAGSTDGTIRIERDLAGRHEVVCLIEAGGAWPGLARNLGVGATSTKWILFVDAGVEVDSGLVQNFIEAREKRPGIRMVIGSYSCMADTRWREAVIVATKPSRAECHGYRGRYDFMPCLIEREFFQELGGFRDWRAGEDLEFVSRATSEPEAVICSPGARVVWEMAPSRRAMAKKWVTYAFHNAENGTSWHRPVLLHNSLGAVLALLMFLGIGWWCVVAPILPHLLRTLVRYRRHCGNGDDEIEGGPLVFLQALVASVVVDAATLIGVMRWRFNRAMVQ